MKTELSITGMTCEHCAETLRRALQAIPQVRRARVSYPEGRAEVEWEGELSASHLLEAIQGAGYRASVRRTSSESVPGPGEEAELLIIGGGSAAFAAAIRAAELGAAVHLVERGTLGGTCVNVGCVPSKTLIKAAQLFHERAHFPFRGWSPASQELSFGELIRQKDELVTRLREQKYRDVLRAHPKIGYLEGEARFLSPRRVEIRSADGSRRVLEARRIVIATGASPWVPPIEGLEGMEYWTHVEALEAPEVPASLVVVGGSAVGVELAQLFSRLGSRVTILEALPTLVPHEDPELGKALQEAFEEEGMQVFPSALVRSISRERGGYRIRFEKEGREQVVEAERLLMATGRRPNTRVLDLEKAGVRTNAQGAILVDETLQSSQAGIYAAGDCATLPQFVYVAARAGTLAAENALLGAGRRLDLSALPAVTFTDPQVASVGLQEKEARQGEELVEVRVLPLGYVPRALANRDTRGMIKMVIGRESRRILGVHILSPNAGEVIAAAALMVRQAMTVEEVAELLIPYLTEAEGLKLAAQTFSKDVAQLSCCAG